MTAATFFHVSQNPVLLHTGLYPGAWGSKLMQLTGNMPKLESPLAPPFWELALETARLAINPQLPSRLNCHFVSERYEDAVEFRDRFRSGGIIYKALLVEEDAPRHRGSFSLLTHEVPEEPFLALMPRRAIRYWAEQPTGVVELIYSGQMILMALE